MDEAAQRLILSQKELVGEWTDRIQAAHGCASRREWKDLADQCWSFFAKDCGFMWKPQFKEKYLGAVDMPMFQITINKAAELVDIYGPYLYWEDARVHMGVHRPYQPAAELFGDIQNDPQAMQAYGQAQAEISQLMAVKQTRADLTELVCNYAAREQYPRVTTESQDGIRDALVAGRGCLWVETYQFEGSNRTLPRLVQDRPENLLIDSDCRDAFWKSAHWIARKHIQPHWEVERRFGLEAGSLKKYCDLTSDDSRVRHWGQNVLQGETNDQICWYEIFSKMGVGTRLKNIDSQLHEDFEEIVGDHAYLCIAPQVPFFLNAPPNEMAGSEDDEILLKLSWPTTTWLDGRWPVACLDFRRHPTSPWPIPPLATAMGELITLNILVSAAVENAYANRRQIIAHLKSKAEAIKKAFQGSTGDVFIEINDSIEKSVNDAIAFINRPGMNNDIWSAIEYVSHLFDKRTGLVEFMYASQGTQDRSARSIAAKEEKSGIRPEKMSKDVAEWMTNAFSLLRICAIEHVRGEDIVGLIGPTGAQLWDQLVAGGDLEEVCRDFSATMEASEMRRPNREREQQNMQTLMQVLMPVLQQVAAARGDQEGVEPLQNFIRDLGRSLEQDTSGWMPPTFAPPPNDEAMQMQQAMGQAELEKSSAEAEQKRADAAKKMVEAQVAAQAAGADDEIRQREFAWKEMEHASGLERQQEDHNLKMRQKIAEFQMRGAQMRQAMALRQQSAGSRS